MISEVDSIKNAIVLFEKLAAADPTDTFCHKQLSKLYFRNNQVDKMYLAYNKILEIDPEDQWTLKRLAERSHAEKKFDEALKYYIKLTEIDTLDGDARLKKLEVFRDKANLDGTTKGKIFYNELKKYKEATNSGSSLECYDAGCAFFTYVLDFQINEEEIQNSMACFKQGIAQEKDNLWCYWGLKTVYIKASLASGPNGKRYYNDAIKICQKAIEMDDENARGHFELAEAYNENYETNMKNEAIKEYRNAIALEPEFIEAYAKLAGIYRHKKLYEKASESYLMVLDIDPTGNLARDAIRTLVNLEKNKEAGK